MEGGVPHKVTEENILPNKFNIITSLQTAQFKCKSPTLLSQPLSILTQETTRLRFPMSNPTLKTPKLNGTPALPSRTRPELHSPHLTHLHPTYSTCLHLLHSDRLLLSKALVPKQSKATPRPVSSRAPWRPSKRPKTSVTSVSSTWRAWGRRTRRARGMVDVQ